jgi:hypothetical protein
VQNYSRGIGFFRWEPALLSCDAEPETGSIVVDRRTVELMQIAPSGGKMLLDITTPWIRWLTQSQFRQLKHCQFARNLWRCEAVE